MKRQTVEGLRSLLEIDLEFLKGCSDHLRYLGEFGQELLEEYEGAKDTVCIRLAEKLLKRFESGGEKNFRRLTPILPRINTLRRDIMGMMRLGFVETSECTLALLGIMSLSRDILESGWRHHFAIIQNKAKIRRLERKNSK